MAQVKLSENTLEMCKEQMLKDPMYKGKSLRNYSDIPNALMETYLREDRDKRIVRDTLKECSICAFEKLAHLITEKERVIDLKRN